MPISTTATRCRIYIGDQELDVAVTSWDLQHRFDDVRGLDYGVLSRSMAESTIEIRGIVLSARRDVTVDSRDMAITAAYGAPAGYVAGQTAGGSQVLVFGEPPNPPKTRYELVKEDL